MRKNNGLNIYIYLYILIYDGIFIIIENVSWDIPINIANKAKNSFLIILIVAVLEELMKTKYRHFLIEI